MAPCTLDTDCPDTLVCYANVSWLLDEGIENRCGCGLWNSWTGGECLELAPGSYYYLVVASIMAAFAILGVSIVVYMLFMIRRMTGSLTLNTQNVTALLCVLSFLSLLAWRIISIYKVLTPEKWTLLISDNTEKAHQIRPIELATLFFTLVFGAAGVLNLSLTWLSTIRNVGKLSISGEGFASRLKVIVIVVQIVWLLAAGSMWTINTGYVFFVSVPLLLFVGVLYTYGSCRIVPLLRRIVDRGTESSGVEKYGDLIRRIRVSNLILVIGISVILAGGTIYSVLLVFSENSWRDVSIDGGISPILISNEAIPAGLLICLYSMAYFLWVSNLKRKKHSETASFSTMKPTSEF